MVRTAPFVAAAVVASIAGMPCRSQAPPSLVGQGGLFLNPITAFAKGDIAHVVFGDNVSPSFPTGLQYRRSEDRGRTWTGVALTPAGTATFAAAGGVFAACHQSLLGGTMQVTRSLDGGSSWLAPVDTGATLRPVTAAFASGTLHVLGSRAGTLEYLRSPDGGATWPLPTVTFGTGGGFSMFRSSGSTLHVAWADLSGVRYRRSADLGRTWSPPANLWSGTIYEMSLEVVGSVVHFACGGTGGFKYQRSADGGQTWSGQVFTGTAMRYALAVDNTRVWLAHADAANTQLVVESSTDHGATWISSTLGAHGADVVAIGADGVVAAVVFTANVIGGSCTIATTADDGATWSLRRDLARSFTGPVSVRGPTIAVAEMVRAQVVQCMSRDAGATWDTDRPLASFASGITADVVGHLTFPGSLAALLLYGQYQGSTRLDLRLLFGHEPYGAAAPGSGGHAPSLRLDGEPLLGRTVSVAMRGCVGGVAALVCASSGRANVSFGSGRLLLLAPQPVFMGIASGTLGTPGEGGVTFSLPVPVVPAMRGQAIDWQGFALDGGIAAGFTSTQGIEAWLF